MAPRRNLNLGYTSNSSDLENALVPKLPSENTLDLDPTGTPEKGYKERSTRGKGATRWTGFWVDRMKSERGSNFGTNYNSD